MVYRLSKQASASHATSMCPGWRARSGCPVPPHTHTHLVQVCARAIIHQQLTLADVEAQHLHVGVEAHRWLLLRPHAVAQALHNELVDTRLQAGHKEGTGTSVEIHNELVDATM
eukprot:363793-Chlamydomonas_euryale.AAC.5